MRVNFGSWDHALFFKPVIGIKIASTAEMSDGYFTISFKETITTIKGKSFKNSIHKGWKGMGPR